MLIPFGAAVIFKPSPTKGHVDKPLPTGQQGIFLGYRFAPGGRWNGEYLVENLEYFAGLDFSSDAVGHSRVLSPHVTKQVRVPGSGSVTFPFKQHYDKVNFTLEGVRGEYRHDSAVDPSVYGERDDADPMVEDTLRETGDEVGDTLRPDGDQDPTTREVPGQHPDTGDHPGFRYDSLGRKYPCDEFGHRIVAGSKRPKGIPPDVWKSLNTKEKAKISAESEPVEGRPASSTDVAGAIARDTISDVV